MASDAGPSLRFYVVAWLAVAYPVLLVATPLLGWSFYAAGLYRAARWIIGLPAAWVIAAALSFMIISAI